MAGNSTEEILVGLVTKRPPVGEDYEVEATGSITIDDLDQSQLVADVFYDAAKVKGLNPPPRLVFFSGEIFYRDLGVEEVRAHGLEIHESRSGKPPTASFWTTPEPPQSVLTHGGTVAAHPSDRERTHIVAHARMPGLSVAWDLRGNADAGENRVALSLYPQAVQHASDAGTESTCEPHTDEAATASSGEKFVPREQVEELLSQLEERVRHRPPEYVKDFVASVLQKGPDEKRLVTINSNFGLLAFELDAAEVTASLGKGFVDSVQILEEDVQAIAASSDVTRERALAMILLRLNLSADNYARYAANLFATKVEGALQNALQHLFEQVHVQALGELNDEALLLPDDPKKLKSEVLKASAKRTKELMDMPVDPGRPKDSVEPPDKREQKRFDLETKIEEAIRKLGHKKFRKTDVANLVVGEYGSSLQSFNKKLERLGIDYDELLRRLGVGN